MKIHLSYFNQHAQTVLTKKFNDGVDKFRALLDEKQINVIQRVATFCLTQLFPVTLTKKTIQPPATTQAPKRQADSSLSSKIQRLFSAVFPGKLKKLLSREEKMDRSAERINQATQPIWKKLASGKAKEVWKKEGDDHHAYFTAVKGEGVKGLFNRIYNAKESEIRDEVRTAKKIIEELKNYTIDAENSNLALDMEELTEDSRKDGKYTVKSPKADKDLEKTIYEQPSSFSKNLDIVSQVANGMKNLHLSGFVHGDLKLENILSYKKKSEDGSGKGEEAIDKVRISDFGKTKFLKAEETALYTGNSRYAPPEGRLSQKGEVFSTAIMLIRIFEEELLKDKDATTLLSVEKPNETADAQRRRGVERFLMINPKCPQTDARSIKGRIKVCGRQLKLAVGLHPKENLKQAQEEIYRYIDALTKGLKDKYKGQESQINELDALLRSMTQSDPNERPTMQKVVDDIKNLIPQAPSLSSEKPG